MVGAEVKGAPTKSIRGPGSDVRLGDPSTARSSRRSGDDQLALSTQGGKRFA